MISLNSLLPAADAGTVSGGFVLMDTEGSNLTDLLKKWSRGDRAAAGELLEQLYEELHRIASAKFRGERWDHTLQPTALVHEAFIRLEISEGVRWRDRSHFLGFAAHLMRQVLVEHARRHNSLKRGGGAQKVTLTEMADLWHTPTNVLAFDEALRNLAQRDAQQARVVELKVFGGLTNSQVARVLEISESTVGRNWKLARTKLYRDLVRKR